MNNKKDFLTLLSSEQPDLATAALLIARHFQPALDLDAELATIDRLSRAAQSSVSDAASLVQFFSDAGFQGNTNQYYDVNNSLLNQVLHRKTGIPISLGIVYLAVVKRLNFASLTATGVNFPGHFLLAAGDGESQQLIDVFDVRLTDERECYARFSEANLQPDPLHFRRATDADVLSRLLENLKAIYWQANHMDTVIDCLDYQLMIFPESAKLLEQQQRLLNNLRHHHPDDVTLH